MFLCVKDHWDLIWIFYDFPHFPKKSQTIFNLTVLNVENRWILFLQLNSPRFVFWHDPKQFSKVNAVSIAPNEISMQILDISSL